MQGEWGFFLKVGGNGGEWGMEGMGKWRGMGDGGGWGEGEKEKPRTLGGGGGARQPRAAGVQGIKWHG